MLLGEAVKKHSNVDIITNKEGSESISKSQIKETTTKGTSPTTRK